MPFGWCPCALFIELSSLHLRKHGTLGQDYLPHGMHITIIGIPGWVPTEYAQVAQIVDCVPPWLRPETSSVVTETKENSDTLSYQEG